MHSCFGSETLRSMSRRELRLRCRASVGKGLLGSNSGFDTFAVKCNPGNSMTVGHHTQTVENVVLYILPIHLSIYLSVCLSISLHMYTMDYRVCVYIYIYVVA